MSIELSGDPSRPWTTRGAEVLWLTQDPGNWVRFDVEGLAQVLGDSETERFGWSDVRDLKIRVPYSTTLQWRTIAGFNLVSPTYGQHSSCDVEIFFRSGYREVAWNLGRAGRYPWQLDFLLDDLLRLLERSHSFAALARPGLLDRLVSDVMPRLPRRARLLMYIDLFGLDRFVGGHGACDRELRQLVVAG